ncbi:uncharacterized protein BP5553_02446 [Venustampulla echinocandica]|uniref:NAD(P)-binding protein n=1 Tax=Venustampulla echinocandica TaxID=2656787 RepID=A0A370U3W1_9HELO|nr:uncharacterized protein BP5553_02446 [Venustampulla echinocandica]RDL42467.1 hypothetical protein BP5553_02446 [Venustampulla echinocandica]
MRIELYWPARLPISNFYPSSSIFTPSISNNTSTRVNYHHRVGSYKKHSPNHLPKRASRGIDKATALALARYGVPVVVNYEAYTKGADRTVHAIGNKDAIFVKADASTLPIIECFINTTINHFDKLDIIIPNAGSVPMNSLGHTTEQDFDAAFNLNVKGPISKDIGEKGICVTAVAPGPTGTATIEKGNSQELLRTITGFNPQARTGMPEDIADTITNLA